jgi:hypothetical protein
MYLSPIEQYVGVMQLRNYLAFASRTLFIYDILIMLEIEVQLILTPRWSVIKAIYLLSRYLPFADMAVLLHYQLSRNLSEAQCRVAYMSESMLYVVGIGTSEVILTYRLWVIWEKDRKLSYALPIVFCVMWGTAIAFVMQFVNSIQFITQLPYPFNAGCPHISSSRIIWIVWILVLLYNAGTLSLLTIRILSLHNSRIIPRLFKLLYRDGIMYYLFLRYQQLMLPPFLYFPRSTQIYYRAFSVSCIPMYQLESY